MHRIDHREWEPGKCGTGKTPCRCQLLLVAAAADGRCCCLNRHLQAAAQRRRRRGILSVGLRPCIHDPVANPPISDLSPVSSLSHSTPLQPLLSPLPCHAKWHSNRIGKQIYVSRPPSLTISPPHISHPRPLQWLICSKPPAPEAAPPTHPLIVTAYLGASSQNGQSMGAHAYQPPPPPSISLSFAMVPKKLMHTIRDKSITTKVSQPRNGLASTLYSAVSCAADGCYPRSSDQGPPCCTANPTARYHRPSSIQDQAS